MAVAVVLEGEGGGGGGSSSAGVTRDWVLEHYGTRLGNLPICRRFQRPAGEASGLGAAGQSDDGDDWSVSGSWASLAENVPPVRRERSARPTEFATLGGGCTGAGEEGTEDDDKRGRAGRHEVEDDYLGEEEEEEQREVRANAEAICWLEEAQAALDTTFWTLKQNHLSADAVLSSSGSLQKVKPTIHALLSYVVRRAPSRPVELFTEQQAAVHAHLCDALKSAFRLLRHLVKQSPEGQSLAKASPKLLAFLTPPDASSAVGSGGHLSVSQRALRSSQRCARPAWASTRRNLRSAAGCATLRASSSPSFTRASPSRFRRS